MTGPVEFENRTLRIGSIIVELEHPIVEAFLAGDLVVVLFRYDSDPRMRFENLRAFTRQGALAWVAELPTSSGLDAYVEVASRDPLVVASWSCHRCTLDPRTGRVTGKTFTK
jgi:hypothetical protein